GCLHRREERLQMPWVKWIASPDHLKIPQPCKRFRIGHHTGFRGKGPPVQLQLGKQYIWQGLLQPLNGSAVAVEQDAIAFAEKLLVAQESVGMRYQFRLRLEHGHLALGDQS